MENNEHDNEQASQDLPQPPVPELGVDHVEIREIPIREITIGECCGRQSYDDIHGLVQSIEVSGLANPVIVNADADGHLTLIGGSRRLEAHRRLGRETISCRIVHLTTAQAKRISIIDNVHRKDMDPVELARQIQSIVSDSGGNQTEVAHAIGWSQPAVSALLGILKLDEDILQQIGIGSESPFKRTHAEILGELMRSTRASRKVEVRQLVNKTINQSLGTKELKSLVQFFTTGGYGRLPERLRTSLLEDKGMTAQMAMLYLEPAKVVEGEGETAKRWRRMADRLDREWLEKHIAKAAKAGWPWERTKQGVLDTIQEQSGDKPKRQSESKPSWQKLSEDISTLGDRLDVCGTEVTGRAKSHPGQLDWLCKEIWKLQSKLNDFVGTATNALDESRVGQSVEERGESHDSTIQYAGTVLP